ALVVAQGVQPVVDIAGAAGQGQGHIEAGRITQKGGGQLGYQFLLGVGFAPECGFLGERGAVEPFAVAGRVGQLVEKG
nr:hypothetical protein [Tanacetum cinerariifolium]